MSVIYFVLFIEVANLTAPSFVKIFFPSCFPLFLLFSVLSYSPVSFNFHSDALVF